MTEEMLEEKVEAAADRFDKFISKKYRSYRFIFKSVSMLAEMGLIIGSFGLKEKGYKTAFALCFGLGTLGIITDVIMSIFFKKSK